MRAKVIFLFLALFALTTGMQAQNWKQNRDRGRRPVKVENNYHHNRRASYHRPSRPIAILPHGYRPIRYNNVVYYYAHGNYYRRLPNRYYEIILPQIGMIVPALPSYNMVRYNGRTYYAYQNYLYSRVSTPAGINFRVDVRL